MARELQSKSIPNKPVGMKLITILFTLRVFARNIMQGIRRRNIFLYFSLLVMFEVGYEFQQLHFTYEAKKLTKAFQQRLHSLCRKIKKIKYPRLVT